MPNSFQGTIVTAFLTKVPLVIIAGQQSREMLIGEPMLANREPEMLPKPYIKWAYQPVRAIDVPAAVIRGIHVASQAPMGPVYISVPLDDWDVPIDEVSVVPRSISTRFGPDPDRLAFFAGRIRSADNLALILGPEVDRTLAWPEAIIFAERLQCPVFQSPLCDRAVFPENHALWRGPVPSARGSLANFLKPFDLVLVVGAEIFRYYPWVPGPILAKGTPLLHITEDSNDQCKAVTGDTLLSDVQLALQGLNRLLEDVARKYPPSTAVSPPASLPPSVLTTDQTPMTAHAAFHAIAKVRPVDAILCHETPSNTSDLLRTWQTVYPESCFTFGSGGLGWNAPAAVGVALAQKRNRTGRQTVLAVGDGSIQYSIQSIYTAVQFKVRLIYLVPVNGEYAVLKEFAELENTPGVPWLDIPGLDAAASARAYGCHAVRAETEQELVAAFQEGLELDGPMLIEFPVSRAKKELLDSL